MSDSASAIKAAEAALDKGDYSLCLRIINPLLESYSITTTIGAKITLIKVTAYIGKGDEQKAINICQALINNKDTSISQQAKQLLSILEAPCLPRPSNWSVEIPKINMESSPNSSFRKVKKKEKKIANHPPTGPTKNLDFGFSLITLLIISLLTFLLSGCVDISTNLSVTGPDRLNIIIDIDSISGKSITWQREFSNNLTKENSLLKLKEEGKKQHFESPTIRLEEVNQLLENITSAASKTSGFDIKKPEIIRTNRNWIIGTRQQLELYINLEDLPKIPGLKINITVNGIGNKNNFQTKPLEPTLKNGSMFLPLEIGQVNQLKVSYWKWDQIAVGLIFTISVTLMSIFLQKFRLNMGFGFPELPP
tara:strand:+ start:7 stop:1101 length:1095 start_codon:yes stop_codon:yes gene_type:complete